MALTIQSFINQAVKLGEKSHQAITVGLDTGNLGSSKVSRSTAQSTEFRAGNFAAWNSFRKSLASSFGAASLPPTMERYMAEGKPLTARLVIQFTKESQQAERTASLSGLMSLLINNDSDFKADLLRAQPEKLLDAYVALMKTPGFREADAATRHEQLAAALAPPAPLQVELAPDKTALGLTGLQGGATFTRDETSVEDLTKLSAGALKKGDALGTIASGQDMGAKRYIYDSLKSKGVEPGFLVTKNWLPSHENALRGELGQENPIFQMGLAKAEERIGVIVQGGGEDAIKLLTEIAGTMPDKDRADQLVLAAITPNANLNELLAGLPPMALRNFAAATLGNKESFFHQELANEARAHIRSTLPEFTEKHVIKLDYNESDRSGSTLRLPQRIKTSHGPFFRWVRRTTERDANRGAVAEALANDITRLIGVPAQKLTLVQGSYRSGSPKLMLDSTFIKGGGGEPYRDFDHFIRDGYLDRDLLKASGHQGEIRDLGKYKAAFLVLGDRDAVGSKGQNKGFVGGSFAAIDPGHSLEGSRVTVRDDFSFTYRTTSVFTSGFKNFTVFDDSSLSEKMSGWADIVRAVEDGSIDQLFGDFGDRFSGEEAKEQGLDFTDQIREMREEFTGRYVSMKAALQPRLDIYNDRQGDPPGFGGRLLDALDNAEKLFSGTSETSPGGKVRLQHLRVTERVPMDMRRDADGIVLSFRDADKAGTFAATMESFLGRTTGDPHRWVLEGGEMRIPNADLDAFLSAFSEDNVRRAKI